MRSVVRRLTPLETERLMGFPDDYLKIDGDAPSALIAYSARDVAALENGGIEGFIVYLKPKGENK